MLICSCGYYDFKNIQFPGNNIIILTCCFCEKITRIDITDFKYESRKSSEEEFKYVSMF